ncbi:MAG TPA: ATP-binding protein [Rhodanobacteraceae bacterium]|nr:ATP-binding protein [Rhodanobacteraceae bacterium]
MIQRAPVAGRTSMPPARQEFPRSFAALEAIHAFVVAHLPVRDARGAVGYAVFMAIEELFTNMVKYNPVGTGLIRIELALEGGMVACHVIDPDSERFDPTAAAEVDIDRPVAERQPGGLGLQLVKRMVDSLSYDYTGRRSTISFVRRLSDPVPKMR